MALFCECNSRECFRSLPITDEVYTAKKKIYPSAAIVLNSHEDPRDVVLENNVTWLVVKEP